uniref:Putative secreted protein n=1 Tax=Anopheles marajoara TaxID=58244 RepID=A0A2M4C7N4_9DIPT
MDTSIAVLLWRLSLQQILCVDLEDDQDAEDGADKANKHRQDDDESERSPRAVGRMSKITGIVFRVELVDGVGVRLKEARANRILLTVVSSWPRNRFTRLDGRFAVGSRRSLRFA